MARERRNQEKGANLGRLEVKQTKVLKHAPPLLPGLYSVTLLVKPSLK